MLIYIKLLLTALFWGGTFIVARVITQNVDASCAAFLRFAIAVVFLLVLTWWIEGSLPGLKPRQFVGVVLLGLTGVSAYNIFFLKGLQTIHASRAALIVATSPIFITIFSTYFFKERLTLLKFAGILLSVTGAIVVISKGKLGEVFAESISVGELYIFGCVLSWVVYSLVGKALMSELSPLVAVSYSAVFGVIFLFIPAYLQGLFSKLPTYSLTDWFGIAYLGVFGTVIGFVWYYEGLRKIGPTRAALFINFVPVSAVVLAFFILNERITSSLLIGGVLVVSGVYLTNKVPSISKTE